MPTAGSRDLVVFVMRVVGFLSGCVLSVKAGFTMLDLDAIVNLTEHLNTKSIVFVEDSQDVGLLGDVKVFSERHLYHTVINTTVLDGILEKNVTQLEFLERRTAIVTKEQLKLGFLLRKVSAPHFLTWIVFRDYNLFPKLYIPVSNQVVFINTSSESISAMQMYHLKPDTKATVKPVRLERSAFDHVQLENINFENVTMDMLILNQKENCSKTNTTLKRLECFHQEILESISHRLNFRGQSRETEEMEQQNKKQQMKENYRKKKHINAVECQEKEHPFTYPNGSDSELFLKLKHREVDFSAISHVFLRKKNREYMELVWPTFVLNSRMYLRQGRLAGRWFTYLRPLESSVWWGILIWILITGVLIQIFEKILKKELKLNFSFGLDLIRSTLKALQVFCNQALTDIPAAYSIRIIYFLKFFVVLIFFQAYCGYLVSSLTVVVSQFPFKDLKGFFESQQYQIMTLRRGFHQFYVRKVIGDGRKGDFMLPRNDLPDTIQQAVDKLCKQKYLAFIEFREDLLNYERLNCRISELPTPTASLYIGIAFPKKMPLKEFLKRELLHLKSTGILQRLGSQLSSHSDFRDTTSQNEFSSVSMTQTFSVFVFLAMGAALSIVILIVELTLDRWKSSRDAVKRMKKLRSMSYSCRTFNSIQVTATDGLQIPYE